MNKINQAFCNIWLKLRHPSVITNGAHYIMAGTEIIQASAGRIIIGSGVSTKRNVTLAAVGGKLEIGNNVSFNRSDIIACYDAITIGNNCGFGPNVVVYDHDHRFDSVSYRSNEYNTSPVFIGDNCWIGANVTILRGTYIGEGCVIGAGTVVKGSIPPHSIVTSNRELNIGQIEERHDKEK